MSSPSTVALVTGASRGIGRDLAIALARKGISVGLVARDAQALDAVRQSCVAAGGSAAVATADVTDGEQVRAAVAAVREQLGPVDLLVNNAGRIESSEVPLWEADPDEWWAIVETDLRGPFLFCHAVLPEMVSLGRGRIVNLTSGVAIADGVIYSGYRAAKTGLLRVTGAVVAAAGERGVTAFDVSPGHVATEMTLSMEMHRGRTEWTPPDALIGIVEAIADGRADGLSGRYLRAGTDDVDQLIGRAEELARTDARTLRLRPYGPEDPLS